MTNSRQQGAYVSLLPGTNEIPGEWSVVELEPDQAANSSTSKTLHQIQIPRPQQQHHWSIRLHEQLHAMRPEWKKSGNKLRDLCRRMLEEVAIDAHALANGFDLRQARDYYDWGRIDSPEDVYDAMAQYLQVWTSAAVTANDKLRAFAERAMQALTAEGKLADVEEAAAAVFEDYSAGNCEDWADILCSKFVPPVGPPPQPPPSTPMPGPPGGLTTPGTGSSASPSAGDDEEEGDEEQSDECPECEGTGKDEDGEECEGCGGTGKAGEGDDEGEDTEGEGEAEGPGGSPGSGGDDEEGGVPAGAAGGDDGDSEVIEPTDPSHVVLNKKRFNEPTTFGYDPLAGSTLLERGHITPPEKLTVTRSRALLTRAEEEQMLAAERAKRKSGESGQSPEITVSTEFGKVDVHRHLLDSQATSSVAVAWRSGEDGALLRYPERLYPNGRVFATRAPGGTILLDCSGSMSWHMSIVAEAMRALPRLYVAGYSWHGTRGNEQRGAAFGTLARLGADGVFIARYCLLARDGRVDKLGMERLQEEPEQSGGNSGADAASLAYAIRTAPKPIIWVSDGMVDWERGPGTHTDNCDGLMKKHRIPRVLTIEDAVDYLRGKAVPGWFQCSSNDTRYIRLGGAFIQTPDAPREHYATAREWARKRAVTRRHRQ